MPYGRVRTPIGARRDRAIVRRPVTVDDGMGGQVAANARAADRTVARIWVQPVALDERTRENVLGRQMTAQQAYHFDTRYRTDLSPKMELEWRGKVLQIQSVVDDDATMRRLILYCLEVQT